MTIASLFDRPILIYDDDCIACGRFAAIASTLSRHWIRTVGHFHSDEAKKIRQFVFPPGYDPTGMFWLVNSSGAHGARAGIVPLAGEVVRGIFKRGAPDVESVNPIRCEGRMSCDKNRAVIKRIVGLLQKSEHFPVK